MGFSIPSFSGEGEVVETRALVSAKKKVFAYAVQVRAFGGTYSLKTKDAAVHSGPSAYKPGDKLGVVGGFEYFEGQPQLQLVYAERLLAVRDEQWSWSVDGQVCELRPLKGKGEDAEVFAYSVRVIGQGATFGLQTKDKALFETLSPGQKGRFSGNFDTDFMGHLILTIAKVDPIAADVPSRNGDGVESASVARV